MNRKYIIALLIVIFLIVVTIVIYNEFSRIDNSEITEESVEPTEVVNEADSHLVTPYSNTNNSVTASNYINHNSIPSDSDGHKEQLYIFREPTTTTLTPKTTISSKTSTTPPPHTLPPFW